MIVEGAQAKWGKGAQAMNLRKDLEAGRTWFNPMFVLPVHQELTLQLGQNALFMADTTIKQKAAREAFYEPFRLTHECTSMPDSLGKIPHKLYETMAKRAILLLMSFLSVTRCQLGSPQRLYYFRNTDCNAFFTSVLQSAFLLTSVKQYPRYVSVSGWRNIPATNKYPCLDYFPHFA